MRVLVLLIVALLAAPALAEIVRLKDGTITSTRPSADAAKERLASLRRSVENLSDPKVVVGRYQTFIKQIAGLPAEKDAQQDLALWQQRAEQKMTKVGGKWITAQERAGLAEKSLAAAEQIRQLLKQGRLKEADAAIKTALDVDPQNPSVIYLSGVLAYRQDQLLPARKAFETVNTLTPNHAPTLNNLAVILFRQKQYAGAMAMYNQAMTASPNNKEILNNIAEAFDALPENERNGIAAQKVIRKFTEQDSKLATQMASEGMYRWGATWVTKQQLDELKVAEKDIRDRLDALSGEFDAVKVSIANIEKDLDADARDMRNIETTSFARMSDGSIRQTVYPPRYNDLKADSEKLAKEREEAYAKLESLRTAARELKKSYPIPQYTGAQRLIDAEGAPSILPAATTKPATAPATRPS